jgi:hypothetical protein
MISGRAHFHSASRFDLKAPLNVPGRYRVASHGTVFDPPRGSFQSDRNGGCLWSGNEIIFDHKISHKDQIIRHLRGMPRSRDISAIRP